jgi:predicted GNAT family acetyltransferase
MMQQVSQALSHSLEDSRMPCAVSELRSGAENEVLEFLAGRPLHTVFMASLIRDNGLVSPLNRGSFYGVRDHEGRLEGVALLGHATLVETRTDHALAAFADLAAQSRDANLVRGERRTIDRFWQHCADAGHKPRLICREMLFEKTNPSPVTEMVTALRSATLGDLEYVLAANALMAFEEGGVNPLQRDPAGFRVRTERRIRQGRVWIWAPQGKTVFKADVIGDTPEMIYLEGIHVHPQERLKGYGKRCLTQLCSILLGRSKSICLTINQRKANAVAFYAKAGFEFHSEYETIYLH